MSWACIVILLTILPGQSPIATGDSASQQAARSKRERLREFYTNEAAGYTIFRDASRDERVELRREPVCVWTNPLRQGGLDGAVFVWTCRGRAEVPGCFWWHYAIGRFTDLDLWVRYKGEEVFTAPLIPYNSKYADPERRYHAFPDRDISRVEEENP
jgi:hypothetical protein